jgi:hypothetical protein
MGSPFTITMYPYIPVAEYSDLSSPTNALYNATTLVTSTIVLVTRDLYRNLLWIGGNKVTLVGVLIKPSTPFETVIAPVVNFTNASMIDSGTGTYTMTYVTSVAGLYSLSIQVNGRDVLGSPFALTILPNVGFHANSITTGPGLYGGMAGVLTSISIRTRDAGLNNLLDFQINWNKAQHTVTLVCPGNKNLADPNTPGLIPVTTVLPWNWSFTSPATWTYWYTPTTASISSNFFDTCQVIACMTSATTGVCDPIPGSPWQVTIWPNQAHAGNSLVNNTKEFGYTDIAGLVRTSIGLKSSTAGVQATFQIVAKDLFGPVGGNFLYFGESFFFFNLSLVYTSLSDYSASAAVKALAWQKYVERCMERGKQEKEREGERVCMCVCVCVSERRRMG